MTLKLSSRLALLKREAAILRLSHTHSSCQISIFTNFCQRILMILFKKWIKKIICELGLLVLIKVSYFTACPFFQEHVDITVQGIITPYYLH